MFRQNHVWFFVVPGCLSLTSRSSSKQIRTNPMIFRDDVVISLKPTRFCSVFGIRAILRIRGSFSGKEKNRSNYNQNKRSNNKRSNSFGLLQSRKVGFSLEYFLPCVWHIVRCSVFSISIWCRWCCYVSNRESFHAWFVFKIARFFVQCLFIHWRMVICLSKFKCKCKHYGYTIHVRHLILFNVSHESWWNVDNKRIVHCLLIFPLDEEEVRERKKKYANSE